jgi:hypothetical protein
MYSGSPAVVAIVLASSPVSALNEGTRVVAPVTKLTYMPGFPSPNFTHPNPSLNRTVIALCPLPFPSTMHFLMDLHGTSFIDESVNSFSLSISVFLIEASRMLGVW